MIALELALDGHRFWAEIDRFLAGWWSKMANFESADYQARLKNVLPLLNQMNLTGKVFSVW